MNKFQNKMQQEYFGFGAIENLGQILRKENAQSVFLVTGKNSFELSGAKQVFDGLEYNFKRFCDFSPNPKLGDVEKGLRLFEEREYDTIVTVGGGSAIDVAKAIKMFYYHKTERKIPLIAIPTTAGSGSEATYFIVYYIGEEKQSEGILEITLPDYAICDPGLTMSLPRNVAASTGIDALAQAIESYWCINSTEESKEYAREAIELLVDNLEPAVNNLFREAKEKVMKAAHLAGKAINISKTTAPHSISYPITSHFGVPHGHAAGLTLGEALVYNANVSEEDCSDKRGFEYVKENINEIVRMLGVSSPEQARDKINNLMKALGLETSLSKLGLTLEDVELIIEKGFNPTRVKNNPRLVTEDNFKKILNKIY